MFDTVIFHNSLWQYLQAAMTLTGIVLIFVLLKRLIVGRLQRLSKKTATDIDDFVLSLLSRVGFSVFFVVALYFTSQQLTMPQSLSTAIRYLMVIVVTFKAIIVLQEAARFGIQKAYRRGKAKEDPSADLIVSSLTGVARWCLWGLGLIFILDNLGVNITTLVAGIGIGGIAVAMASQVILGDAFSAVSIFLDRPFELGDFIIVGNQMGTVEHIGIKTTRIRSLSGEQLVFSNSDLTKNFIQNFKRMQKRRVEFSVRVSYQTPPEKAKKLPQTIKDILLRMKDVSIERVHLAKLADDAFVYQIAYYVNSADYGVYMDRQQELNFAIMDVFKREEISFGLPAQTIHLERAHQEAIS